MGLETIITPLSVTEEEDVNTRNFRNDLLWTPLTLKVSFYSALSQSHIKKTQDFIARLVKTTAVGMSLNCQIKMVKLISAS